MRKLKYVKFFENFEVQRTEKEILSEDNLEDLSVKLNNLKLKNTDTEVNHQIEEIIMLLDGWAEEKLGIKIAPTDGNVYQDKIRLSKDELIDEIKSKLQEVLRFCSAGNKYYDEVVKDSLEGLLQMI
jgi:hypothetical protein